jgi:hypothetical protein
LERENHSKLRNEVFLLIHVILTVVLGGVIIWLVTEMSELTKKVKILEDQVINLTVKDFIRDGNKKVAPD